MTNFRKCYTMVNDYAKQVVHLGVRPFYASWLMTGGDFLAGGIPEKTIDMVRSNADILDVVGNFVQMLAKTGWVFVPSMLKRRRRFQSMSKNSFFTVFRADAAEMFLSLSWNLKT